MAPGVEVSTIWAQQGRTDPPGTLLDLQQVERINWDLRMSQYWVVGAWWGKHNDQFDVFTREGYWELGWGDEEQPDQTLRRNQIQPGDRIAIKKRHPKDIEIRALGIVKRINRKNNRVYVRWVVTDLHHRVPSKGCFKTIHGPFTSDDEWIQDIFWELEHSGELRVAGDLPDLDDDVPLAQEGAKTWRWHLKTERNRRNVERKKAQVMREKGSLDCELWI